MSELKPCPFCGGTATLTHSYDADNCYWAYAGCNKCGVRSRGKWTSVRSDADPVFYQEVRDEWNRRAPAEGQESVARVPTKTELQRMAKYFRDVGELWEGPDGCATPGTRLAENIAADLYALSNTPMALGLTDIKPYAQPQRPAVPDVAQRHIANEWADMATNGLQWLKNIRDGISTVDSAIAEMQSNYERIYKLTAIPAPERPEQFNPQAAKLATLAEICSQAILGGECGYEKMDFEEFKKLVKAALAKNRIENGTKLWLWQNGDHFWAFTHLYPCSTPGGDPMTLGEPVGYAIFKQSHDR